MTFHKYITSFHNFITDQYPQHANPYFLGIFRIFFSTVAILYALKGIEYIDLRWQDYDYNLILALHIVWIFILILMFLGIGGILRNIIQFPLVLFLLDPSIGTSIGFSVQETIYLLPSFWICFINLDRAYYFSLFNKNKKLIKFNEVSDIPSSSFPIFGFCINFGTILLFAGIDKALDPLWIDGIGFYSTAKLPWIHVNWIHSTFEFKNLWILLNYLSILMELSFLFLSFFKRTRFLSILLLFFFFGGLIFPLRITFIGELGLSYLILVASITNSNLLKNLCSNYTYLKNKHVSQKFDLVRNSIIIFFLFLNIFYFVFYLHKSLNYKPYDYKKIYNQVINTNDISEIEYRNKFIFIVFDSLINKTNYILSIFNFDRIQQLTIRQKSWHLFTRLHTVGIYEFKIKYKLDNGAILEPVSVFNDDMSGTSKTKGLYSIRYLQAIMYPLSNIANKVSVNNKYVPTQYEANHIKTLLKYGYNKLSESDQNKVIIAYIEVRPINFNFEIETNKTFLNSEWRILCEYNFINKKSSWGNPQAFNLQSRVRGLPNFWLTEFPYY